MRSRARGCFAAQLVGLNATSAAANQAPKKFSSFFGGKFQSALFPRIVYWRRACRRLRSNKSKRREEDEEDHGQNFLGGRSDGFRPTPRRVPERGREGVEKAGRFGILRTNHNLRDTVMSHDSPNKTCDSLTMRIGALLLALCASLPLAAADEVRVFSPEKTWRFK